MLGALSQEPSKTEDIAELKECCSLTHGAIDGDVKRSVPLDKFPRTIPTSDIPT